MNYINKVFTVALLIALAVCGIGIFLPFHNGFHFMNRNLYNYLFLIVLVNFLFVFLKKHTMLYKVVSLCLSIFIVLLDSRMNYISRLNIFPLFIGGIFAIAFIVLLLVKANWNTVFIVNCIFIFIFLNWLGLSYVNPFSSYLPTLSEMIIKNIKELFELRGIGYFISNIGVISAIVFQFLCIILDKRNIKRVKQII
ncbi:UNVERIFIED_CONTAM: hypothetical protein Cloal_1867 [Acetivibrio alkalicellulosi]